MELRQLEYFITAARLKNLTRAAEHHFVSQPNITIAIKKLEEELGVLLFNRFKNSFTLTPEGELFLIRATDILKSINNAILEVKDLNSENEVLVGIPPMIASFLLLPLVKYFRKNYPNLKINFIEDGSIGLQKKISSQLVDLAILITDNSPQNFETISLIKSKHLLCVKKDNPILKQDHIYWEDLANQPLILMNEDAFHRQEIISKFQELNIKPNLIMSSNDISTNLELVLSGEGNTFILKQCKINSNEITLREVENTNELTIGIAWNKDKYLSNTAKVFINSISAFFLENFSHG